MSISLSVDPRNLIPSKIDETTELEQRDMSILTVNSDRKEVNYNRRTICQYNAEEINFKKGHKKIGGMLV